MKQRRLWVNWAQRTLATGDSERSGLHRIYNGNVAFSKHAQFLNRSKRRLHYDNLLLQLSLLRTASAFLSCQSFVTGYLGASLHLESWPSPFSDLTATQANVVTRSTHWLKMCHFHYRKFDACGHHSIEVGHVCDEALWRAGLRGVLQVCVPRILERSLEWSGRDDHEPPKPALFRGYDGFCEQCVVEFKVGLPQKCRATLVVVILIERVTA